MNSSYINYLRTLLVSLSLFTSLFALAQESAKVPLYESVMMKGGEISRIDKPYLPKVALKSNVLYLATATVNASVEFGMARRWTTDLTAAYNPFKLQRGGTNQLWFAQPELRYWFCQRFEGHFIGLHGIYGGYNIGKVGFLTETFREYRYKGWGAGAGISWGYHVPMAGRWAWEFSVGVGYIWLDYDKHDCYKCDRLVESKKSHYFGPTKAAVSLIFMIK